jgi:hypothetical protein
MLQTSHCTFLAKMLMVVVYTQMHKLSIDREVLRGVMTQLCVHPLAELVQYRQRQG